MNDDKLFFRAILTIVIGLVLVIGMLIARDLLSDQLRLDAGLRPVYMNGTTVWEKTDK